jgi:transcriptional regulator with GAF, ATPase, and Fis domain
VVEISPTQVVYEKQQAKLVLRTALLRVTKGPDSGKSCSLERGRLMIGASQDSSLVLTDPLVSRHHLEIQIQDRGYLVVDQGSTNGTFFRGARIHEVEVGIGAEIHLGDTCLRLEQGPIRYDEDPRGETFGSLIGISPAMQKIYGLLASVAPTDVTVLIEGETGTGKELIAEELHRQSPRGHRSFNVVDCGSLPRNLIESELFGHERGAFTGAISTREGIFERSQGGTLFLDEVGELPLELQTRLLRVLDRRVVRRVGSNLSRKVDVRLVAATNRQLDEAVRNETFRKDLFYRLAVVRVLVPPLRQRRQDIPLLARHFLWQAGCHDPEMVLTPEVLKVLARRKWSGNVRELRNMMERAIVLADGHVAPSITVEPILAPNRSSQREEPGVPEASVSDSLGSGGEDWLARALPQSLLQGPYKESKAILLEKFERLYMIHLMALYGGNISKMAQQAGIDRRHVRKMLDKHGLRDRA